MPHSSSRRACRKSALVRPERACPSWLVATLSQTSHRRSTCPRKPVVRPEAPGTSGPHDPLEMAAARHGPLPAGSQLRGWDSNPTKGVAFPAEATFVAVQVRRSRTARTSCSYARPTGWLEGCIASRPIGGCRGNGSASPGGPTSCSKGSARRAALEGVAIRHSKSTTSKIRPANRAAKHPQLVAEDDVLDLEL
jgi:hypothetical protein